MINLSIESYNHLINYKIFTSFHSSFPALTVVYRIDGNKYFNDMLVDLSWGSGGVRQLTSLGEYTQFSTEMADAWDLASKIFEHHKTSKEIFKEIK